MSGVLILVFGIILLYLALSGKAARFLRELTD